MFVCLSVRMPVIYVFVCAFCSANVGGGGHSAIKTAGSKETVF